MGGRPPGSAVLLGLLLACGAKDADSAGGATPVGLPTGTVQTGPVTCLPRLGNVLLIDCVADLPSDQPATAHLIEPSGAERVLESVQSGTSLAFTIWRLYEETAYEVRVEQGAETLLGGFTTGTIPVWAQVAPVIEGSPSFSHLLVPSDCGQGGTLLVVDRQGVVVWYMKVSEGVDPALWTAVDGIDVTERGVAAVVGRWHVREWSWTQELLLDVLGGVDTPGPVHHDVLRHDGYTYVISAESTLGSDGFEYVTDTVTVVDPEGEPVANWHMRDHVDPTGFTPGSGFWSTLFPDAFDWSHTNGIEVTDDRRWLLSSRAHSTVLSIQGDWTQPDFGAIQWALSGDGSVVFGSDFSLEGPAPAGFSGQHHPNFDNQGRLVLFDNREGLLESSRIGVWSLDEAGGVATLQSTMTLPEHCSVQGGAYPLANGHVVATCAPARTVYELVPGATEPLWRAVLPCADSPIRPLMVRTYPLNFP